VIAILLYIGIAVSIVSIISSIMQYNLLLDLQAPWCDEGNLEGEFRSAGLEDCLVACPHRLVVGALSFE